MTPRHPPNELGEWRDYRRDDSRMGVQPLSTSTQPISAFKEQWSVRLGGGFQEVEPIPDGSGDILMADAGGIQRVNADGQFRWRTKPFGAHWIAYVGDLDTDGKLEILTSNGRELIILSADSGEFLFRDVVGPPLSYGTYAPMFKVHSFFGNGMQILVPCFTSKEVLMFDCSQGARNTRILHKLWMDDGYHPSIVIGDVNNDGTDEIVIARLGGVYVFEPHSGTMISQTVWNSDEQRRRNYGHFELADINNDGNLEAIILSDKVSRHIAVLGNDGHGTFHPLWDRLIEHIYPTDTTELRYASNSIRDFNGDSKLEIAVSIFNDRKDNRWHTEILHAETGECILDLPDQYLRGVQDVNGDGSPELCLSQETARTVSDYSELSIYAPLENKTLWRTEEARFAEHAIHPSVQFSEFKPDVFAAHEVWSGSFDGRTGLLIHSGKRGLSILQNSFHRSPIPTTDRSHGTYRVALFEKDRIIISQPDGNLLHISPSGSRHFLSCGYHLTTEAHIAARPGPVATIAIWNGARYLTIPDFSGNIHIFKSMGNANPEKVTTVRGRSRLGYDGVFHAASVMETHDGPRLVVVGDEDLSYARLSLYSLVGEHIRSYEFPDLPASNIGNRIGCYDWLYFQHSRGEAIFASFYQSPSMNSECSLAFLIETGEMLWRISSIGEGEYGRGAGPWGTSALVDGTIAVFCAKDTLCYLDLQTGTLIRDPNILTAYTAEALHAAHALKEQTLSTHSSTDDPFTAYGTPMIHGNDHILAGCLGGFGMLRNSGVAKWWHRAVYGDVLYKLPGIADVDGDGKRELGQPHADGTFRIYDYETGALRASRDLQSIATDVLTLGSRFIVGASDGRLIAIGWSDNEFAILDEIETGAAMGSPIAADFDGDGVAEIYVVTGDGNLRCFGSSL